MAGSLQRKVALVSGGKVDYFAKANPDLLFFEMAMQAAREAVADLGLQPKEFRRLIRERGGIVITHFADHFAGQLLGEALTRDYLGLNPAEACRVIGGGATGGLGVQAAMEKIASGRADIVIAIGYEKMSEVDTFQGNEFIALASDTVTDFPNGGYYPLYYAAMAQSYLDTFVGRTVSAGEIRDAFSKIAVMMRNNAQFNRRAQTSRENPYSTASTSGFIAVDDVVKSGIVATPSYRLDCCLMTDGASAVVLACEELARQLTDQPVYVTGIGNGTDCMRTGERPRTVGGLVADGLLFPHEREDPALVEYYRQLEYPGLHSFRAGRWAARKAYEMAGIRGNPLEYFDLIEIHDAFVISVVQTLEDLGMAPYGHACKLFSALPLADGRVPINPRIGGEKGLYVNPSGGLIGQMHAVGATGNTQAVDVLWQMQGKIKEKYGHAETQVPGPKTALFHSHAGTGSDITVTTVERGW
ncbi:MAG: thiolase domain-containing protein [Nitrospinae bacterium]|nr:thiolase domain-containing protein [Nitrospinota bacterium]